MELIVDENIAINYKKSDKDSLIHILTYVDASKKLDSSVGIKDFISPTASKVLTSVFNDYFLKETFKINNCEGLPLNTKFSIKAKNSKKYWCTFIDSKFSTGSIAVLLHGGFGSLLYTGYFCYYSDFSKSPALMPFSQRKATLNTLYLDATYYELPSNFSNLSTNIDNVLHVLRTYECKKIYIYADKSMDQIICDVASQLDELVYVEKSRFETIQKLGYKKYFTTDIAQSRIFVAKGYVHKKGYDQGIVIIFHRHPEYSEKFLQCGINSTQNVYYFHFYSHSTHSECCKLISELKPEKMIPIQPTIIDTSDVHFTPVSIKNLETKKFSILPDSVNVRTPPVKKIPKRKSREPPGNTRSTTSGVYKESIRPKVLNQLKCSVNNSNLNSIKKTARTQITSISHEVSSVDCSPPPLKKIRVCAPEEINNSLKIRSLEKSLPSFKELSTENSILQKSGQITECISKTNSSSSSSASNSMQFLNILSVPSEQVKVKIIPDSKPSSTQEESIPKPNKNLNEVLGSKKVIVNELNENNHKVSHNVQQKLLPDVSVDTSSASHDNYGVSSKKNIGNMGPSKPFEFMNKKNVKSIICSSNITEKTPKKILITNTPKISHPTILEKAGCHSNVNKSKYDKVKLKYLPDLYPLKPPNNPMTNLGNPLWKNRPVYDAQSQSSKVLDKASDKPIKLKNIPSCKDNISLAKKESPKCSIESLNFPVREKKCTSGTEESTMSSKNTSSCLGDASTVYEDHNYSLDIIISPSITKEINCELNLSEDNYGIPVLSIPEENPENINDKLKLDVPNSGFPLFSIPEDINSVMNMDEDNSSFLASSIPEESLQDLNSKVGLNAINSGFPMLSIPEENSESINLALEKIIKKDVMYVDKDVTPLLSQIQDILDIKNKLKQECHEVGKNTSSNISSGVAHKKMKLNPPQIPPTIVKHELQQNLLELKSEPSIIQETLEKNDTNKYLDCTKSLKSSDNKNSVLDQYKDLYEKYDITECSVALNRSEMTRFHFYSEYRDCYLAKDYGFTKLETRRRHDLKAFLKYFTLTKLLRKQYNRT